MKNIPIMGVVIILALAAVLQGCSQSGDGMQVHPTSFTPGLDGPEAKNWLLKNGNESAFASNRFGETKQALTFVERLYLAGAKRVIVPQESIDADVGTLNIEGGPYADALLVTLPEDPAAAQKVFEICALELSREGFDPAESKHANQIYLWWD